MMYSIHTTSTLDPVQNLRTRSEDANCLPGTIVSHSNYNHTETVCQLRNMRGPFCRFLKLVVFICPSHFYIQISFYVIMKRIQIKRLIYSPHLQDASFIIKEHPFYMFNHNILIASERGGVGQQLNCLTNFTSLMINKYTLYCLLR